MTRNGLLFVTLLFLFLAVGQHISAGEVADVEEVLRRSIIASGQPLLEVRNFCEARVLPMPAVATAEDWEKHAERIRRRTFKHVVYRGEAAKWRDAETRVEWLETIEGGPGYRIKKLRYEALPGLWIPALLYEPIDLEGKVPVVMNVNGHDGDGKAAEYKQIRCINQAKRGMLALNVEWLGMGQLRSDNFQHYRMNQIDLCGTSGLAPFYLTMKRGLDVLLSLEHSDSSRVAVAGLSGGGWQTIVISALDERVTLANPVAGYSSYLTRISHASDLGDSEQTPVDLATTADYHHLTALRAPRPTLLTYNAEDNCCFKADHALPPLLESARPIFALYGKRDNLRSHVNDDPGDHNFALDNRQQLYKMFADFFYPEREDFDPQELPCDDEVKTKEQLHVELPADNADFNSLALALSERLPRNSGLPTTREQARGWQKDARKALVNIVKAKQYAVQAASAGSQELQGGTAHFWKVKVGNWTVPAVELSPSEAKSTVVLVADEGRKSAAKQAQDLFTAGIRVLAVDPFYLGESQIEGRDFLYALLVSAVGERPLGLQASQVAAIAAWAHERYGGEPLTVAAVGPRSSLFALVAAALDEDAIGRVELHGSLGSLREVIEENMAVRDAPELFCFGLLKAFDIRQLVALAAPRRVQFVDASPRARKELKGLAEVYEVFGTRFDPLK